MGMYTELIFGAKLKSDTPGEIINTLHVMMGDNIESEQVQIPGDPFFKCDRWMSVFNCGSYYFGVSNSVKEMWFDAIDNSWRISTRANLKNYDGEIDKFLQWIKPYIDGGSGARDFYAIVTYEESEEPTIYYLY